MRYAGAWQQGVDEDLIASLDNFETADLTDRHKAALRVADDYLTGPGTLSASDRHDALEHFGTDEITEIVVRLMQYSRNKVRVSLGLDLDEVRVQLIGQHRNRPVAAVD